MRSVNEIMDDVAILEKQYEQIKAAERMHQSELAMKVRIERAIIAGSSDYRSNLQDWIARHNAYNMSPEEVAKLMLSEAINNTSFADDVYPSLKDSLLRLVDK